MAGEVEIISPRRKETRWIKIFLEFIKELRISSKEVMAQDERGTQLDLWGSQRMFLDELAAGLEDGIRTFYVCKARQLGVSTISLAITIFWMAMYSGIIGCLVVDTEDNRSAFRDTLRRYVKSLPPKFVGSKFRITTDNKNVMIFSNGSRLDIIVAGKTKANWSEGRGYAYAHVTEIAAFGNPDGIDSFRESLAEANPDRLFIYESTSKGYNKWRSMYIEGGRDTYTIRRMFIGWFTKELNSISRRDKRFAIYGQAPPDEYERQVMAIVKDRHDIDVSSEQLCWYRWRDSSTAAEDATMKQNQPWTAEESFVMSGYSFFQTRSLQKDWERIAGDNEHEPVLYKGYRYWLGNDFFAMKIERIEDEDRRGEVQLRVWEEPVEGAEYVIGVDPAFGRTEWADRHAIQVCRCYADRLVQVAEYADNNPETRQCAWVVAHLAGVYKNCLVNIELGGPGRAIFTELEQLRSRLRADMYAEEVGNRQWDDAMSTARWYLYHRPDSMGSGYAYHTQASFEITHTMMNQLRDSYASNLIEIRSIPLVEEMLIVVQDGSHIGAPNKTKDDRVFAAALANRSWLEWMRPGMIQRGYTYESVAKAESGESRPSEIIINNIVANFIKGAEERSQEEPSSFLSDRGLE